MPDMNPQQDRVSELAMTAADEELRRRRERGKLSQARFRKRQAQVSQETRDENQKLKDAIAAIVGATHHSDRNTLLRVIRDAANVAGINVSALDEEGCDNNVREESEPDTCGKTAIMKTSMRPQSSEAHSRVERSRKSTASSTPPTSENSTNSPENETRGREGRSCMTASRSPSQSRSRGLSPRLDYGIWLDASRAMRVTTPPAEIVPFLGPGRYTFAGQLYWACADYIISLCRLVTTPFSPTLWFNGGRPEDLPSPDEAEGRLWNVLQHTPPLHNVRLALALAEAQREFRDTGYVWGDSLASNPDLGTLLRKEVEADKLAHGDDLSIWMTITELEAHLRRQLGSEVFSRLEKAMATYTNCSTGEDGGPTSDPEVPKIVRLLLKNLAESYICFGDGPRWRADRVYALFSDKIIM